MVIVNLMGGLGNQLFQYSAGRALSKRLNTELLLDLDFLERDTKGEYTARTFELDKYNIVFNRASPSDLASVESQRRSDFFSRIKRKIFTPSVRLVTEQSKRFNPSFQQLRGNCYLHGFWQSEKYFSDIRETILTEIRLRKPVSERAQEMLAEIKKTPGSVAIHFRRGDYVNLASANQFHGTASLDYYNKAVSFIKKNTADPYFFIFSDDIDWVKENFRIDNATFVSGMSMHEDLELMRSCRHNIIANSSFSWWGAWLNINPEKIVVAPATWFNDSTIDTSDIIPSSWVRI